MRAPICNLCLDSPSLCESCQEKLDSGAIRQEEVVLSRSASRLCQKYPSFEKAEFTKAVALNGQVLVIVPKGTAGHFIGKGGIFIKELSEIIGKRVKVVEETKDVKESIQKILYPARFLGVNVIYSDGKEVYKIRVHRSDEKKVYDIPSLEGMFGILLDGKARLVFE